MAIFPLNGNTAAIYGWMREPEYRCPVTRGRVVWSTLEKTLRSSLQSLLSISLSISFNCVIANRDFCCVFFDTLDTLKTTYQQILTTTNSPNNTAKTSLNVDSHLSLSLSENDTTTKYIYNGLHRTPTSTWTWIVYGKQNLPHESCCISFGTINSIHWWISAVRLLTIMVNHIWYPIYINLYI